jgi:hypothetical protein
MVGTSLCGDNERQPGFAASGQPLHTICALFARKSLRGAGDRLGRPPLPDHFDLIRGHTLNGVDPDPKRARKERPDQAVGIGCRALVHGDDVSVLVENVQVEVDVRL